MKWFATSKFLNVPLAMTLLLVMANVMNFLFCLWAGGNTMMSPTLLVARGALTAASAQPGQYWHLIAYGFLHANVMHLGLGLLSLLSCGPFLERRLGPSIFMVVFVAAVVGGGLASVATHAGPFASVGAAGGTFGIIGALFALWVLGSKELSASFFLINFSMNFAFATRAPNIDGAVHIGGFVTGMLCVALLNLVVKTNIYWLKCKFPEFAKLNIVSLAACAGIYLYLHPLATVHNFDNRAVNIGIWLVCTMMLLKLIDICLAVRHGLIGAVMVFAMLNSLCSYVCAKIFYQTYETYCQPGPYVGEWMNGIIHLMCVDPVVELHAVTAGVFVLTLILDVYPLQRGFRDVGFVGATFMAERRRQRIRGAV